MAGKTEQFQIISNNFKQFWIIWGSRGLGTPFVADSTALRPLWVPKVLYCRPRMWVGPPTVLYGRPKTWVGPPEVLQCRGKIPGYALHRRVLYSYRVLPLVACGRPRCAHEVCQLMRATRPWRGKQNLRCPKPGYAMVMDTESLYIPQEPLQLLTIPRQVVSSPKPCNDSEPLHAATPPDTLQTPRTPCKTMKPYNAHETLELP